MQVHGTSDLVVSYNGSFFSGLGVTAVLGIWADHLEYATPPTTTPFSGPVEKQVWAPCNGNASVVHFRVRGGGHVWFDTADLSATSEIRDFFQTHSCGQITTATAAINVPTLRVWPVPTADMLTVEGLAGSVDHELWDARGRLVLTGRAQGDQARLDLGAMDAGAYLLRLMDGSGRSLRVLKQ